VEFTLHQEIEHFRKISLLAFENNSNSHKMKSVSVSQRLSAYLKVNTSVQKHSIDFMLKDLSHLNFFMPFKR